MADKDTTSEDKHEEILGLLRTDFDGYPLYDMETEEPEKTLEQALEYLDGLRESGRINMFGAASWLEEEFSFPKQVAKGVLGYWMETF